MSKTRQFICEGCGQPPRGEGNGSKLVVDHCHETGKVRALLCSPCNKGIGHLRDSVEIVIKAASYLEEHKN